MVLVDRHPLDDRIGFGLEDLDWSQSSATSRTSRSRAIEEQDNYVIRSVPGKKWAFEVERKNDPKGRRTYSVRYDAERSRGWCSCLGFKFNTTNGNGPCVHLWLLKLAND